jgi:ubiquinone/menaquinone biosynthesis C-methylase UbiE
MSRLTSEQAFHDRQARARAHCRADLTHTLYFSDAHYLDHETWIRPAFALLGELRGLSALDYGCGHGMAAVVLARRGAIVCALDLSHGYLSEARRRAHANGAAVTFVQADAERLPFPTGHFQRVWGNAVLHHLNIHLAAGELYRVLAPGGVAVFCEPWGENPLLSWARQNLAYAGKDRTPDEQPLRYAHVRALQAVFPQVDIRGYQLLSMVRRVLGEGRIVRGLRHCDRLLLNRLPRLQRMCRYVVLSLRKGV